MNPPTPALRSLPLLLGLVAVAGATGCQERVRSDGVGQGVDPEPRYGGTVHLMSEAPATLDPVHVDDVYEACIANQIHDGLLEFDANLNPMPAIAREWSVSRDGRDYSFTLRTDVKFHNGRTVTAHDFVYSFTRMFDPAVDDHGIGGEYLRRIEGVDAYARGDAPTISGITAPNDTTLSLRLETPYGSFLSALSMDQTKVVPREEVERWGDEYAFHPCGTGPFRLAGRHEDGDDPRIVLTANPDYFRGRPYLDEIVFHVPKDYNPDRGVEALLDGKVNMCDLPGARHKEFETDPDFEIIRRPELSFSFVGINMAMPPMDDERVRRAFAHAIDRSRLLAVDPEGRQEAVGILPPGMFGYSPEEKVMGYDPEKARALLAEAGYPEGRGLPSIECWQAGRTEVGRRADEVMAEDVRAVGFDLRYRYVEWEVFEPALDALEIPVFGLTWVADVPDPDSFLASLFLTTGSGNLFRYADPVVDSLLVAGSEMRSSVDRARVYRRSERRILEDVPVIPLFHHANSYAVRAEMRGLHVTPFGLGNLHLERVWLDAAS